MKKVEAVIKPFKLEDAKHFQWSMLLRSSHYFLALARAPEVLQKGCRGILHGMPHFYYKCLLQLSDLSAMEALGDSVPKFGNRDFQAILRGEEPEDPRPLQNGQVDPDPDPESESEGHIKCL